MFELQPKQSASPSQSQVNSYSVHDRRERSHRDPINCRFKFRNDAKIDDLKQKISTKFHCNLTQVTQLLCK